MNIKGLFFFVSILFLTAFTSYAQQMGLYPLSQYSVGAKSDMQLRTTTALQQDTLKIPYIEDFSGYGLPIDSISIDTFSTGPTILVYRITHLKMHGLKSGDSIRVYNVATENPDVSNLLNGVKFVNVINKYTFQLFKDHLLQKPDSVHAERVHYFNWIRKGKEGYSSIPDTLGFLDNHGGVFINNDMALNPISIGVATFDGVNYKGIPYSTGTAKGYADNLTSLPFNLSAYTPSSNIYMSFYWQSKSLGDSPLSSEFLYLEFKNAAGNWIEVWNKQGATVTTDTFMVAMIPITNSSYLHKSFQYRFRSYGVLNGRFNVWNLDYIYIDTNRMASKPYFMDVSIITTNRSALKNYTSVPYKHIRNLSVSTIGSETAQAFMKIRDSLTKGAAITIERKYLVRDNLGSNNDTVKFEPQANLGIQRYVFTQPFTDTIPGGYMQADKPYVLKEEFYIQPLDTLGPIDMTFNNFTAIETYFHDYYSYDDGTPEVAFLSTNPGGTKVAVGYKILKADQLTHIDYCFIRNNGPNLTNSDIRLNVWKRDSTTGVGPGDPIKLTSISDQQVDISYSSDINGFVRYELTYPLALDSGSMYYFGYIQNFTDALFLGYDKNNDHLDNTFFCNNGITWQKLRDITSVTGSLMIRPVFSENEIVTSIDISSTKAQQNQFSFYPNPAKNELHFTGQPEYISVYDLSGLLLLEKKVEDEEVLSTETLSNGLYLVILSKGNYKEVKRLIIQK